MKLLVAAQELKQMIDQMPPGSMQMPYGEARDSRTYELAAQSIEAAERESEELV